MLEQDACSSCFYFGIFRTIVSSHLICTPQVLEKLLPLGVFVKLRVTEGNADSAEDWGSGLDQMTLDLEVLLIANTGCKRTRYSDTQTLLKNLPGVPDDL